MSAIKLKTLRIGRLLLLRSVPPALAVAVIPSLRRWDFALVILGLSAWMLAESLVEDELTNRAAVASSHDRGTRFFILGAHLLAWWAPLAEGLLRGQPPAAGWFLVGFSVMALGAVLRVIAVRTLGGSFTAHVQVRDGQGVCERGVYGLVRHPSYVALFFLNTGPSLAVGAWISSFAVAAATLYANHRRVGVEEAALAQHLGAGYHDYCARVPRWVPTLRLLQRAIDKATTKPNTHLE
ncbi:methyltransferase family protein [Haliangium sp.]|uniref:methyltransferase family protein n=1 Tax=Haliangium sp. TaxID=2663208 RepID=UPI003D0C6F41